VDLDPEILKIPHIFWRVRECHDLTRGMKESGVGAMAGEFHGVSLGDIRLDERLRRIVELSAAAPDDSFPEQMTRSERVAASRAKSRAQKESSRWEKLAGDVSDALPDAVRAIHIMDQALLPWEAPDTRFFTPPVRGRPVRTPRIGLRSLPLEVKETALFANRVRIRQVGCRSLREHLCS
jgi:hypothetical protein